MIARIKIDGRLQRNTSEFKWEWVYYGRVFSDRYPEGRIVWWGDWRDTLTHCCDYLYNEHRMQQEDTRTASPRQFDLYRGGVRS